MIQTTILPPCWIKRKHPQPENRVRFYCSTFCYDQTTWVTSSEAGPPSFLLNSSQNDNGGPQPGNVQGHTRRAISHEHFDSPSFSQPEELQSPAECCCDIAHTKIMSSPLHSECPLRLTCSKERRKVTPQSLPVLSAGMPPHLPENLLIQGHKGTICAISSILPFIINLVWQFNIRANVSLLTIHRDKSCHIAIYYDSSKI